LSTPHTYKTDVSNRLSKIEGHVRGIKKMLDGGKECEDLLLQISAVQAALSKVSKIILNDHLEQCIINEGDLDVRKQSGEKLKSAINKIYK
jgi:CsoR family transcriptional regulator, copper-sensing transcriptional repressor